MREVILDYVRRVRKSFPGCRWYVSPRWSWSNRPVLPAKWFHRLAGGTRNDEEGWVEYDQTHESIAAAVKAHPGLEGWPRDVVVIVAARAGEELRGHMEGVHAARCRDCDTALHVDTKSIRTIEGMKLERHVKFCCRDCVLFYRLPTEDTGIVLDQRGGCEDGA